MSPQDIDESITDITTRPSTPKIDPSAHTYSMAIPNPEGTPSERERDQLDQDSYFPPHDSMIIVDGLNVFTELTKNYGGKIKEYNKKLAELRLPYRIRSVHKHVYRHFTYYYFGHYIYVISEKPEIVQEPTITDTSLPKKRVRKKRATKKAPAKKNGKDNQWEYLSKFDEIEWHHLLDKQDIIEIGMPPRMNIPNLKFHVAQVRLKSLSDKEVKDVKDGIKSTDTNTIIMPYLLFMNPNVKILFKGFPCYRLA